MIKNAVVLISIAAFSAAGWAADESRASRQETIGLGSGGVVGAAAGGPVGFIVGAAVGAWLGDRFNQQHQAQTEFEQNWMASEAEVAELNGLLQGAEHRAESMQSQVSTLETRLVRESRQMRDTIRAALDLEVLFKTDEDTVPTETEARLLRLASVLAGMQDTLVRIEGHADARGDTEHNAQLSAQRAATVRSMLIRAGVPADRISVDAYGEEHSSAPEDDLDALAMERRVHLTLIPGGDAPRVARE